ncbi:MAG: chorismate synthase [Bacteroidales bacterium]|nr:chorismate synthase [Bacteroidales bacterium]
MANCKELSFGKNLVFSLTGSSHGEYTGGILCGIPKGVKIDEEFLNMQLQRRRPGKYGTKRKEDDCPEFLSGITGGITNGEKLEFRIKNQDVRKQDYKDFEGWFRPSHADYPYYIKYKEDSLQHKDMASARMYLPVTVAGTIARMWLLLQNVRIDAKAVRIGGIDTDGNEDKINFLIEQTLKNGDTLGGRIRCSITGVRAGLGEPVFDKISSSLAKAVMNIPSAVSFAMGDVLCREDLTGSTDIDNWTTGQEGKTEDFKTSTNHCGGVNAGITNGMPIVFYAGFHAVHTLGKAMTLISKDGELKQQSINGRHDMCAVLRTPVIVESVAALVIADYMLVKTD